MRIGKPYLLKAKYAGKCSCGKAIAKGDEAMYYPVSKKLECRDCATRTLDALADEEIYATF
jgi:hypothetical protein